MVTKYKFYLLNISFVIGEVMSLVSHPISEGATLQAFRPVVMQQRGEIVLRTLVGQGSSVCAEQHLSEATLQPGRRTTLHAHPEREEIYYVTGGRGCLTVGTDRKVLAKGDVAVIKPGVPHCVEALKPGTLKLLIICNPKGAELVPSQLVDESSTPRVRIVATSIES
jgi:quercetin dioxygenase-like cupin family protein